MSNQRKILYNLIIVVIFISIHAEKPACIDYISNKLSETKSMEGVYTKEIFMGSEKIKTKITFFDDKKKNKKHMTISDSKGIKNDIFIVNDTLFVIDKMSKSIYFMGTDEYGEIGKKMFDINVFESLSMLAQLKETDSISVAFDKNKKLCINFVSDTSNLVYSNVIVRFNNDSLPELIEMYDWSMKVILQIHYTNYKDKLPREIRTLSNMEDMVLEEKISINKIKINSPISAKNFEFSRKGYKILSLQDAMEPFIE